MVKKQLSLMLAAALTLSVCVNVAQLCFFSHHRYKETHTEIIQPGTYLDDPEQIATSNLLSLDGVNRLFYYFQNDSTVLKQGRYEIKEDGTGVFYDEKDALCGYAAAISRESIQVFWTDNSYTIFGRHQDATILP
ncbi:MAG: hypothetical protein DBY10_03630 [Clostridiales bacterium]|jgi:hypothetical protein|nr:MAG: hypothetical protein DBY10_03630 [Clostridiales bacterium]